MDSKQIRRLVEGTADAAFAVDASGLISAWNAMAEELLGLSSTEAIGRGCHEILAGHDDAVGVCSRLQQEVHENRPVANFDLQIHTKHGSQWCNVTVLIVTEPEFASPHAVYIIQPRGMRERLQQLMRNFVLSESDLRPKFASQFISAIPIVSLTARETQILRMLARGAHTNEIAKELSVSGATVKNHISHTLIKLNAHTRLEAIRRAEQCGLIKGNE